MKTWVKLLGLSSIIIISMGITRLDFDNLSFRQNIGSYFMIFQFIIIFTLIVLFKNKLTLNKKS